MTDTWSTADLRGQLRLLTAAHGGTIPAGVWVSRDGRMEPVDAGAREAERVVCEAQIPPDPQNGVSGDPGANGGGVG